MSNKSAAVAAATTTPAGQKAIQSGKIELSNVQPKKGSVRLNSAAGDKNPIVSNVYLDRTRLAFMGVPEGHVPTKIRVHIDVLETAPESSIGQSA